MKNKRNIIIVAAVIVVVIFVAAALASGTRKNDGSAEAMVETFMEAAKDTDLDAMLDCTVSEDWASYVEQLLSVDDWKDFVVLVAPKMTYEITNVEESGNQVTITVDVTYIDAEEIYVDAFNAYASRAIAIVMENEDASEEDLEGILGEVLQEKAETMEETYMDVTLTFVCSGKNNWKISEVDDQMQNVVTSNLTLVADALDAQDSEDIVTTTEEGTTADDESVADDDSVTEETSTETED